MKIKEIEYSKTFNLGNYESEKIGIRAELDDGEDKNEAFTFLKRIVEWQNKKENKEK